MSRAARRPITRPRDPVRGRSRLLRAGPLLAAVAVLGVFWLGGCCVVRERVRADEALPGEQIRGIRRGATTKQEILERFGPPAAVARPGTTTVYPPAGAAERGHVGVSSDALLELFSTGRALRDTEIVYYYAASRLDATGVLIVPIVGWGYHSMEMAEEQLWLLIDDRAGVVEDYVFRGVK